MQFKIPRDKIPFLGYNRLLCLIFKFFLTERDKIKSAYYYGPNKFK